MPPPTRRTNRINRAENARNANQIDFSGYTLDDPERRFQGTMTVSANPPENYVQQFIIGKTIRDSLLQEISWFLDNPDPHVKNKNYKILLDLVNCDESEFSAKLESFLPKDTQSQLFTFLESKMVNFSSQRDNSNSAFSNFKLNEIGKECLILNFQKIILNHLFFHIYGNDELKSSMAHRIDIATSHANLQTKINKTISELEKKKEIGDGEYFKASLVYSKNDIIGIQYVEYKDPDWVLKAKLFLALFLFIYTQTTPKPDSFAFLIFYMVPPLLSLICITLVANNVTKEQTRAGALIDRTKVEDPRRIIYGIQFANDTVNFKCAMDTHPFLETCKKLDGLIPESSNSHFFEGPI